MNRRHFFKWAAVLVGTTVVRALPASAARSEEIEIQRSPVAGFQYGGGEAVWDGLSVGDRLDLVREPGNPHDERAVRVEWNGVKLGYVPRSENAAVSFLLDAGRPLDGRIVRLLEGTDPWARVRMKVNMTVPGFAP